MAIKKTYPTNEAASTAEFPTVAHETAGQKDKHIKYLRIGFIVSMVFIIALSLWLLFSNQQQKTETVITKVVTPIPTPRRIETIISGTTIFQGYAPSSATISVVARTGINDEFKSIATGLPVTQGTIPFVWKAATPGVHYEIKSQLFIDGKSVQESNTLSVSAPATHLVFTLISPLQPSSTTAAKISGNVHLRGYIPSDSSLLVQAKDTQATTFNTIVQGIVAADNAGWLWSSAVAGRTYNIIVQLADSSGKIISSSPAQAVTAPSSGLLFDINSSAQPSTTTLAGVSGFVIINGQIPTNSRITIGARRTGQTAFKEVAGSNPARSGTTWKWDGAQTGAEYQIQAYLWKDNKPYAQSSLLTVIAPSSNETLVINAQLSPTPTP